ncbi:MAG: hypothetical protein QM308_01380 [Bacillota bacterium]|nr:hypothetical protein [Bacillota bacterium]
MPMKKNKPHLAPSFVMLDNAAKIYPAARTRGWMPMFRISLTFKEVIDKELMQQALDDTLKRLPLFSYRLKRGLFWYYLESQEAKPRVEEDARNPMLPFNLAGETRFMFRLRVHKRRVALEVFHALTDGYGASTFLMTLAARYLSLRDGAKIPPGGLIKCVQEQPQKTDWEDSFPKNAGKFTRARKEDSAWQLSGTRTEQGFLRVITGVIPSDKLLLLAREKKTTVNTLLAAVLLLSLLTVRKGSRRRKNKPVKLSLPVNLRKYYDSTTLRNFSFYVNVPVYPGMDLYSVDKLIPYVGHYMGLETMESQLNARFTANVRAEQNFFLRLAPLFLKTLVLKLMYKATGERYVTSTLTNLGRVDFPPEMEARVERMNLLLGPAQKTPLGVAVISACGNTSISFSKTIKESEVERVFFTTLIELGIPVLIESNEPDGD